MEGFLRAASHSFHNSASDSSPRADSGLAAGDSGGIGACVMDFNELVGRQREWFEAGHTRSEAFRRAQLQALERLVREHDDALLDALQRDLGKPPFDAYTGEIAMVLSEIRHVIRHLRRWMKPQRRRSPMLAKPAGASVRPEPKGSVLIIGPWNYPVQLLLAPLIGALAAGNCAVLKPSELAPHTAALLAKLLGERFDPRLVAVVEGDREVAEALLEVKFDHIFFTGSTEIGRKVMAAAARHLTPVTLELGGKCPAIVCGDLSGKAIQTAARRIVWGKFMNAGQTCIAPDYVLADRRTHDPLVAAMSETVAAFYTGRSPGKIVNRRHLERLAGLLGDGTIVCGGGIDVDAATLEPTILTGVAGDSAVMREEIFGPVLPVMAFDSLDEALAIVRGLPPPLAVYPFTLDGETERRILAATRSGGVCVNDTILQITDPDLPFGGVGESGMGRYHGRASFDCFSDERVVVRRGLGFDPKFRYPPPDLSLPRLKKLLRFFGNG
jgi:aldehyde dehydrogenase (NAD+)